MKHIYKDMPGSSPAFKKTPNNYLQNEAKFLSEMKVFLKNKLQFRRIQNTEKLYCEHNQA